MKVRRFAVVVRKLLKLLLQWLMRWFVRWFAVVPKRSVRSMCGGSAVDARYKPPYPLYALRGACGARRGRIKGGY